MKKEENPTIGFRVPASLKQKFEEIAESKTSQSKAEIFNEMIAAYEAEILKKQTAELEQEIPAKENEKEPAQASTNPFSFKAPQAEPEQETQEDEEAKEITLKLSPVHVFMLKETLLKAGFIDETNESIAYINKEKPVNVLDQLGSGGLFSGVFKGLLRKLNPDLQDEKVMNQNMADVLLNLFVFEILLNSENLSSPVTRSVLKGYMESQDNEKQLS